MQLLPLRREAWEIQDFNGVWTCDLAILVRRSNQLRYEAADVGSWSFVGSNGPVRNESMMKWYMKWIMKSSQTPLKSWIFQASLRNCKSCVHNCEDHSLTWFHIRSSYMIHFIYHFIININFLTIIITLRTLTIYKLKKKTTKQSEQSHECLQVE